MTGPTVKLTPAQDRMLAEVRAAPGRVYNGRARRTVTALAKLGMVSYTYDLIPHGRGDYTERYIVTPKVDA